jgi:hypothetical protein
LYAFLRPLLPLGLETWIALILPEWTQINQKQCNHQLLRASSANKRFSTPLLPINCWICVYQGRSPWMMMRKCCNQCKPCVALKVYLTNLQRQRTTYSVDHFTGSTLCCLTRKSFYLFHHFFPVHPLCSQPFSIQTHHLFPYLMPFPPHPLVINTGLHMSTLSLLFHTNRFPNLGSHSFLTARWKISDT